MQRFIVTCAAVLLAASLWACGAKTYTVTTKGGATYTAVGDPKYDMQRETYTFKTEDGSAVTLNREDVDVIVESD